MFALMSPKEVLLLYPSSLLIDSIIVSFFKLIFIGV